jgi:hypothetical protein
MNRRDALKAALASVAVPGPTPEVVETKKPFIAVIHCEQKISDEQRRMLSEAWKHALVKTDYPDLPLVIVQSGMRLTIVEDSRGAV